MPVFNKMVYNGTEYILGGGGGNIGEPTNISAVATSNSSVDITWTDNSLQTIPPSTFQKSELVRKIGSAPTSPSDGDLVVTETVINTYQSSAYSDTGLTEGTTYYYQVFSYSTDGGITYGTPVSATPQGGWQPGANTLLYLPLNSTYTYTDQSGNQVSTTNANVTFGTYQGVDCGTFSNDTRIIVSPFNIPNDFTFVGRCYNTGVYQFEGQIFDARNGTDTLRTAFWISSDYYGYCGGVSSYDNVVDATGVNFIQNQWVLFAFVTTDGKQELYVKGNSIDNYYSTTYQYSGFTPTNISIGQEWNNGASRHFIGGLSNIIIEDKVRTAQEISGYYNQTKGDYGIS